MPLNVHFYVNVSWILGGSEIKESIDMKCVNFQRFGKLEALKDSPFV